MDNYLEHHGILGQRWGVRRYQNPDGSLTSAGRKRYSDGNDETSSPEKKRSGLSDSQKKALKIGAAFAGTALAAYGTYKVAQYVQGSRQTKAMQEAYDYVNKYSMKKIGETGFVSGLKIDYYADKQGTALSGFSNSKAIKNHIDKHNANVMLKANEIYGQRLNTKTDKAINAIVKSGDTVKSGINKVGSTVKTGTNKAGEAISKATNQTKNTVLDTINPKYTYVPGETRTTTKNFGNISVKKTSTNYNKVKVKRT